MIKGRMKRNSENGHRQEAREDPPPSNIRFRNNTEWEALVVKAPTGAITRDDYENKYYQDYHKQKSSAKSQGVNEQCRSYEELLKASKQALQQHLKKQNCMETQPAEHTTSTSTSTSTLSSSIVGRDSRLKKEKNNKSNDMDEGNQNKSSDMDKGNQNKSKTNSKRSEGTGLSDIQEQAIELLKDDPFLAKAVLYLAKTAKKNTEHVVCSNKDINASCNDEHSSHKKALGSSSKDSSSEQEMIQNAAKAICETARLLQKSVKVVHDSSGQALLAKEPSDITTRTNKRKNDSKYSRGARATDKSDPKRENEQENNNTRKRKSDCESGRNQYSNGQQPIAHKRNKAIDSSSGTKSYSLPSSNDDAPSSLTDSFDSNQNKKQKENNQNESNATLSSISSSSSEIFAADSINGSSISTADQQNDEGDNNVNDSSNKKKPRATDLEHRQQWERILHERPDSQDVHGTIRWLLEVFHIATLSNQTSSAASTACSLNSSASQPDTDDHEETAKDNSR